jgi:hypothetical protein
MVFVVKTFLRFAEFIKAITSLASLRGRQPARNSIWSRGTSKTRQITCFFFYHLILMPGINAHFLWFSITG